MIKTVITHTLLDHCINVVYDRININFTTPKITDEVELFHKNWRNLGVCTYNQLQAIKDCGAIYNDEYIVNALAYVQCNYDLYQQRYIVACNKFKIIPRKLF